MYFAQLLCLLIISGLGLLVPLRCSVCQFPLLISYGLVVVSSDGSPLSRVCLYPPDVYI
jgi:hypothetical protein